MLRFLKNILQLILSPLHAWEEISYEDIGPEHLAARGMYPLLGLVALSAFLHGLYQKAFEVGAQLQEAVGQFVALLATYYIGVAMFDTFVSRFSTKEVSTNKSRTIAIYIVALLAIIQIIDNVVPIEIIILQFLPLFAAIVLAKATTYLAIDKKKEGGYILFAIGALIIPWFVFKTLLAFIF